MQTGHILSNLEVTSVEQRPLEESGLVVPTSRREFLKKSAVAGAVVWSAPAIATLPGGGAWAAQYGPGACDCTENAYALKVFAAGIINISEIVLPQNGATSVATVNVGNGLIVANVLNATTDNCAARASVLDLTVNLGDILQVGGLLNLGLTLPTIFATVLESTASANGGCPEANANIARLELGGSNLLTVGTGPNTGVNLDILGAVIAQVIINEQGTDCVNGQTSAFANALHIHIELNLGNVIGTGGLINLGGLVNLTNLTQVIDVVVSHAEVAGCNCPC